MEQKMSSDMIYLNMKNLKLLLMINMILEVDKNLIQVQNLEWLILKNIINLEIMLIVFQKHTGIRMVEIGLVHI